MSKKFNFLFNDPKVNIKVINYNLTIQEKIKLFFFILGNKISKIYILAPKNYYYYLRNLVINLDNGDQIFIGVATDYAQKYPDAPYYWVVEKNNIIDKNGSTNIEKYSLYFELSK